MLARSGVWEKCDLCKSYWDGFRLQLCEENNGEIVIVCPLCRGISDWVKACDDDGRV